MPKIFRPFERAMDFLWKWEGGYSNDPADPGGATNFGITLATAKANGMDIDGDGDVDVDDIRLMTPERAMPVYKHKYWDEVNGNGLPWDVAIAAFDAAVNVGPGRVNQWLIKAMVDKNPVRSLNEQRRSFYNLIIQKNPALKKFKNGWYNRVNDLDKYLSVLKVEREEEPVVDL